MSSGQYSGAFGASLVRPAASRRPLCAGADLRASWVLTFLSGLGFMQTTTKKWDVFMRRAVWTDSGLDVVEDDQVDLPAGWVRLQVSACGICGSDLHMWCGTSPRHPGRSPGHEFCGTVIESTVADLPDRLYAVSPNVTCGQCVYCATGRPHLCRRGGYGIGLGRNGGFADTVDAPVENLFDIDDRANPLVASMAEPLAVALSAVHTARLSAGSVLLVLGGGSVGQLCGLAARDRVERVAITTRYPHQRRLAESNGLSPLAPEELATWAGEVRPDAVIDTIGGSSVDDAIASASRGGRVVLLGSLQRTNVEVGQVILKGLTICGSFAYGTSRRGEEFASAVRLLPRYLDELGRIQTHQLPLARIEDAFRVAADKSTTCVKVTVVP